MRPKDNENKKEAMQLVKRLNCTLTDDENLHLWQVYVEYPEGYEDADGCSYINCQTWQEVIERLKYQEKDLLEFKEAERCF